MKLHKAKFSNCS